MLAPQCCQGQGSLLAPSVPQVQQAGCSLRPQGPCPCSGDAPSWGLGRAGTWSPPRGGPEDQARTRGSASQKLLPGQPTCPPARLSCPGSVPCSALCPGPALDSPEAGVCSAGRGHPCRAEVEGIAPSSLTPDPRVGIQLAHGLCRRVLHSTWSAEAP